MVLMRNRKIIIKYSLLSRNLIKNPLTGLCRSIHLLVFESTNSPSMKSLVVATWKANSFRVIYYHLK